MGSNLVLGVYPMLEKKIELTVMVEDYVCVDISHVRNQVLGSRRDEGIVKVLTNRDMEAMTKCTGKTLYYSHLNQTFL